MCLRVRDTFLEKPARLIIRLLFEFASDSVFDKLNQSTNSETAMLSSCLVMMGWMLVGLGVAVRRVKRRPGCVTVLHCYSVTLLHCYTVTALV